MKVDTYDGKAPASRPELFRMVRGPRPNSCRRKSDPRLIFGFGLLHGFGFASALTDLGLPSGSLALSLAGFNVGVELGQLAIVAILMPLSFGLRTTRAYRIVLVGGSAAVATTASIWLVERAADIRLFSVAVAGL